MDALTRYIVIYYSNLMTPSERVAHKASIAEEKAENLEPGNLQTILRERCGSNDSDVVAHLKDGQETFLRNVRDRILKEHANEVFLNYCPKCGALTNTPNAQQCPECFHSWHGDVEQFVGREAR
jgi:rubrerythrin